VVLIGFVGVAVGTGVIEIGASRQLVNVAVSSLTLKGIERDLPSLSDPQDIESVDLSDMNPLAHPCFPTSGVPKFFGAAEKKSPPNVFESVTPFRATAWRPECTLAVSRNPADTADLLLRGGGGSACAINATIALEPKYVQDQHLCNALSPGQPNDVTIQPLIRPEGSLKITYASPTVRSQKYRAIVDNYGAGDEAALDVDRLDLVLAESLPDKKCPGAPEQTVVITPSLRGAVRLDRLAFDSAGLRAFVSMTGPHTVAVQTTGTPCESDERSISPWKLVAIVAASIVAFLQAAAKFIEHLKRIIGELLKKKHKRRDPSRKGRPP
jgi:hypothetical protein